MITVLGRISSLNVRKVLWLADEAGLAYTREDWGLPIRDPNTPEFLALNPNAQVPVLRDGDFVLWESNAILRYLGEAYAPAFWPKDQQARARADQWLTWQATELNPAWSYAFQALSRRARGYDDANEITRSITRWTAKMRLLEAQLSRTSAYAAGEAMSLADIAIGLSVHRWFATPFDRPDLPNVHRYDAALRQRPAAHAYLDPAIA